jgi:hypothetical protein
MTGSLTARATAERHAQDVVDGNLARLMGDFSGSVLTELMGSGSMPPNPTTKWEILSEEADDGKVRFRVRYTNDTEELVLETTWSLFDSGAWKIVKAEAVTT